MVSCLQQGPGSRCGFGRDVRVPVPPGWRRVVARLATRPSPVKATPSLTSTALAHSTHRRLLSS